MFEVSSTAAAAASVVVMRRTFMCIAEDYLTLRFRALPARAAVVFVADHLVQAGLLPLGMLLELPVLGKRRRKDLRVVDREVVLDRVGARAMVWTASECMRYSFGFA